MASLADRIKAKKLTPEMLGMDEPAAEMAATPALPLQSFVKESPAAKEEILAAVEADKSLVTSVEVAAADVTVEETPKAKRAYNKKSLLVETGLAQGVGFGSREPTFHVCLTVDGFTIGGYSTLANLKETIAAIRAAVGA